MRSASSLPPPPPPPAWASDDPWGSLRYTPPEEPRPPWLVPLGIAITSVFLAGVVGAVVTTGDAGPGHPDRWDPRVVGLADFVEDERGRDFDEPVYVDFLSAEEYTAETRGDEGGLTEDAEREDYEEYAAQLRALGVASGEPDLYEAFNTVVDSGTLAFYDPVDERVRVRGTEMTVGLQVTIVHELTHALQDQRFDLDRINRPDLDTSASTAFRALGEGDALRVENAYIEKELTDEERSAYDEEYAGELADSEAATSDVPPYVEALFGAPYALGQPFVTMLLNDDGNKAVDRAFEEPPDTEEHVFDPASYLAGEEFDDLELDLPDDVDVLEEGPFGATSWYLVLAERIDPRMAFEAALGWNGDAFAAYEQDGVVCVQAAFVGDAEADEEQMAAALDAWEASMVGGKAKATEVDGHPAISSCDPGGTVDMKLSGRSESSLYLPNLWGYLVADAAAELDAERSRCYARTVLDQLTYEQITDPEGSAFKGDAFQRRLTDAFQTCSG